MNPNPIIWAMAALAVEDKVVTVSLEPAKGGDWIATLDLDGESVAEAQAGTPAQALSDLEDTIRGLEQKWR